MTTENHINSNPNNDNGNINEEDKKKKRRRLILLILLLLLLIGFASCTGYYLGHRNTDTDNVGGLSYDPSATEKQSRTQNEELPGVSIPGWGSITIPANTTEINTGIDFYNPEENINYDMTFTLKLLNSDGSEEVLYTSDLVAAGKHIYSITLNRSLTPGTYNASVFVQPYEKNSTEPLNNAEMKTTLYVQ